MNATLKIKLRASNLRLLEQKSKDLNLNSEELINRALDDYFYFERLRELRKSLINVAKHDGIESEDALFDAIS
ncbi:MAG: hypothetical protein LCH67_06150 [Bacteroidetes bacterium]|nr:hypothetical protein [Bacteroidota bacterium]